jgi:hypothetical protein
MLSINSVILLAQHYRISNTKVAIDLASKELDKVLDETREYPVFIYYLILENMDNNPLYDGKKFHFMSKDEKIEAFNDTINQLYNINQKFYNK